MKVSLKKAAVETTTGMAILGTASKVAKKFQNSKINQKFTKKLDDVTSSLKSKTKNVTANIAKKTKEATQKAVNTVSDKAKTIANKTLNGTSTSKSVKNKVASAIDSLGEGILNVQNAFAPSYEFAEVGVFKVTKNGLGESGEKTLSQALGKDVKRLKAVFFNQDKKSKNYSKEMHDKLILWSKNEADRLLSISKRKRDKFNTSSIVYDVSTKKYYYGRNNGININKSKKIDFVWQ